VLLLGVYFLPFIGVQYELQLVCTYKLQNICLQDLSLFMGAYYLSPLKPYELKACSITLTLNFGLGFWCEWNYERLETPNLNFHHPSVYFLIISKWKDKFLVVFGLYMILQDSNRIGLEINCGKPNGRIFLLMYIFAGFIALLFGYFYWHWFTSFDFL
jgi:hypothetical protein